MKVGDKIMITWSSGPPHHKVGDILTIKEIGNQCFQAGKNYDHFNFDNKQNWTSKYKLLLREEKLKRILND